MFPSPFFFHAKDIIALQQLGFASLSSGLELMRLKIAIYFPPWG
jgi:hypothetical protein